MIHTIHDAALVVAVILGFVGATLLVDVALAALWDWSGE